MSLVNLAHVCSHLQNASKARLGITSIPFSRLHVNLAHQLQKSGFISTVTLGGSSPPPASSLLAHPPAPSIVDKNATNTSPGILDMQSGYGLYHPPDRDAETEPKIWELMSLPENEEQPEYNEQIPSNPAQRRLWLGMKYYKNEPVLSRMGLVSKPKRRIWMGVKEFLEIVRGSKTGYVHGMRQIGECMYISTDRGIMEIRECIERELGGMLLCRVW